MFGSPLVPCMVNIGSIRRHYLHSLAISPALLVNASFTSIPSITSWFCLVSLCMNCSKCVIVSDAMLSFSNLSWRIIHCFVSAVSVFVGYIVVEHTLYTDMMVRCLPSCPWRVMNDHLLNPWLSSPLCDFLDLIMLYVIIAVPPGLYMECQGR